MNWTIRLPILVAALGMMMLAVRPNLAHGQGSSPNVPQGGSATFQLDWAVLGQVSGGESASASYRLSATIGQPGAGMPSHSVGYGLCGGFECGFKSESYQVYLPLAIR